MTIFCCNSQTSPSNVHQRMLRFMRPDSMQTTSPIHVQQSLLNKYRSKWMDGWMDEWMNRWLDEWMDGNVDG